MKSSTYHIFFGRLANKLRIDIITSLLEKPKSVSQLIKELKQEQSKISHALKALLACKIVKYTQKGKQRIYSLSKTISPILKAIKEHEKCSCKTCPMRCK